MDHPIPTPSSTPNSAPAGVTAAADAIHDGLQLAQASTANLAFEPALYVSGLARDIADAAGRLISCRTPLDLLAVQQTYVMARGQSWLDSAYRCFERSVTDEGGLQREPGRLVFPE